MEPNYKSFFRSLTLAFLLWAAAADGDAVCAQSARPQPTPPPCPSIGVLSQDQVTAGQPIAFIAEVRGGDQNVTPTYNWTVSAGTIESGQGTSVIKVDTTGINDNGSVTATVDVGGFARDCFSSNSATTSVLKKVVPRKFNEYGAIKPQNGQALLDDFAVEMLNDPTTQGYLIFYGGRRSKPGDVQKTAKSSLDYLVKKRAIAADRLIIIDGGYREESTTELWIVPSGAAAPQASPTVDPSEVRAAKSSTKSTKTKTPAQAKPKKGKKS